MGRAGRKSSFLKLRISLELERKEDEASHPGCYAAHC